MDTHSVSTALGSLDIKAIHFGQAVTATLLS